MIMVFVLLVYFGLFGLLILVVNFEKVVLILFLKLVFFWVIILLVCFLLVSFCNLFLVFVKFLISILLIDER